MPSKDKDKLIHEYFFKKGLGIILETTFDNDIYQALNIAFPDLSSEIILSEGVAGLSDDWIEDQKVIELIPDLNSLINDLQQSEKKLITKIFQFYPKGNIWIMLRGTKGELQSSEQYYETYKNYNQEIYENFEIPITLKKQGGIKIACWTVDFSPHEITIEKLSSIVKQIAQTHYKEIKRIMELQS